MKKGLLIVMCILLVASMFTGCGKQDVQETAEVDYTVDYDTYKDSEDIPDWTGKQIKVNVWQDVNAAQAYNRLKKLSSDVVTPEYTRITGVTYDYDNSIDNNGDSYDARITQIIASGDYPAMAYSLPELSDLVKTDALYELSDYIEKYCPSIMKYLGPDTVYGTVWKEQEEKYGGLYAIPWGETESNIRGMVEEDHSFDLTEEQISSIAGPGSSPHGYVYVRDDILKMIYPEAHTYDELQAIFDENGGFTEEEVFDVPWNTPQDFIDFLYKAKELELPDDGLGKVYTMYTHDGTDNWNACTVMLPMFGYSGDYFGYYNIEEKHLKYTFKENWFKDILKTYNQLVRDGVASSEALLDTQQGFNEKMTNGRYLVSIGTYVPVGNESNQYKYRKVYAKYTNNYEKILNTGTSYNGLKKISFFKKGISEEDLIQVLKAIDFSVSLPGQKLCLWGTKSAGLYTETEDGILQFKDENLKNQMTNWNLYGKDLVEKYGLMMGPWPGRPYFRTSPYRLEAMDTEKSGSMDSFFLAAYVDPIVYPVYANKTIYNAIYTSAVEGAKSFWQARNAFEDSLTQIFAADSDAQFEERYNNLVALAERNGYTDETLEECQAIFDKNAKLYEGNIEAFLEKYGK